jgi:DNA-binding NarL/FixJ family response regulator
MKGSVKIAIIDDHTLFREGLSFLLKRLDFISKIYEASNGGELLANIKEWNPELILMDIEMPEMNGIETTKILSAKFPNIKVVAISMYADEDYYSSMIESGAKGFILKNSKFQEVETAIKEVLGGHTYFSAEIMDSIIGNMYNKKNHSNQKDELSTREIEVLFNICKGKSNLQISEFLNISKRTVDKHRENLLLKTGVNNTAGLVVYAIKNGFFEI